MAGEAMTRQRGPVGVVVSRVCREYAKYGNEALVVVASIIYNRRRAQPIGVVVLSLVRIIRTELDF